MEAEAGTVMDDDELCVFVAQLVDAAEEYRDTALMPERVRAMEYYDGVMADMPTLAGRSKVVSRDVRATINKVLPSVVRTILGNDRVVEYQPVSEEDEEVADQATDYINNVVLPECNAHTAIRDAFFDALLCRNGVLEWRYQVEKTVTVSRHSGLDEASLAMLTQADDITVLEKSEAMEPGEMGAPVPVYAVKIRRMEEKGRIRLEAVPPDEFLIHPEALTIEDSPLVGRVRLVSRSQLVAMGYDRAAIEEIPSGDGIGNLQDERTTRRGETALDLMGTLQGALDLVRYYELYVTVDQDGDGIAELRKLCFAGAVTADGLLANEEWDDRPFASVVAKARPHQWEGISLFDDVADIQRVKTQLTRATLDNLYWQNNQQPVVQEGTVTNMDAVLNPEFGRPIRVRAGVAAKDALAWNLVPFVAEQSFAMLSYLDQALRDRTGISEASSGLAPDALQNMTAKASAMIEQAGIGQVEQVVRTLADGLRRAFKGILKLTIQHQDKPRAMRLRGAWVQVDPRAWNADMDCTVNVGLGAGTRERDMLMMNMVMGVQEKILAAFGPDNPFVKPDNLYNAVAKTIEAAGLKNVGAFITNPDPQEVQAKLQAAANKPSPEKEKAQAQMEVEQFKAQAKAQGDQQRMQMEAQAKQAELEHQREAEMMKAQVQEAKEQSQMRADIEVKRAEMEKELQASQHQAQADFQKAQLQADLRREEMDREERMKMAEMEQQRELEMLKLGVSMDQPATAGPDGKTVKPKPVNLVEMMGRLVDAQDMIARHMTQPRQFVRDENGDVVGIG